MGEPKKYDVTLEDAIKDIRKRYDEALKLSWVKKPVSYALYHTWIGFDEHEKERD